MNAAYRVYLVGNDRPFLAEEIEYLPGGWLRATGHYLRWDVDDFTGETVVRNGAELAMSWPPQQIKKVVTHVS